MQNRYSPRRKRAYWLWPVLLIFSILFVAQRVSVPLYAVVSPSVRISQVYGGGGNGGATYTHDFVELFNGGTVPVSLSGWSVQYASAPAGTSWQKTDLSGSIQPGQYYLIQQRAGAGGTTPLPMPDAAGAIGIAATNGKVVLLNTNTLLADGTSCPSSLSERDS